MKSVLIPMILMMAGMAHAATVVPEAGEFQSCSVNVDQSDVVLPINNPDAPTAFLTDKGNYEVGVDVAMPNPDGNGSNSDSVASEFVRISNFSLGDSTTGFFYTNIYKSKDKGTDLTMKITHNTQDKNVTIKILGVGVLDWSPDSMAKSAQWPVDVVINCVRK